MLKKLLFIGLLISVLINFNYVFAETSLIVPIKKPSLSEKEIKEKRKENYFAFENRSFTSSQLMTFHQAAM